MKIETIYEIGQKPNQEDTIYSLDNLATCEGNDRVFVLCDGMGGHEHGEVASSIVANTIGQQTSASGAKTVAEMRTAFNMALDCAYEKLDESDHSESVRKMGTTLTFLAFCDDGVLVAHIGDSRIYQFRQGEGIVFQTRDHSLVNDLLAAGELTEDEARTYSQRNVITRAVMPHQEYRSKATFRVLTDVRRRDIFMLCSDGVVEQIDNKLLTTLLLANKSLADKCENLRKACAKRHTRDNHSCILLEVEQTPSFSPPQQTPRMANRRKPSVWLAVVVTAVVASVAFSLFSLCRKKETKAHKSAVGNEQRQPVSTARRLKNPVKEGAFDTKKKTSDARNTETQLKNGNKQ